MRVNTFIWWSLLLPLILPWFFLPLRNIGPQTGAFYDFATVMYLSGVVGAIPYLLSVAVIFPVFRGNNDRKILWAIWSLPVIMALVFAVIGYAPTVIDTLWNHKSGLAKKLAEVTPWVKLFVTFTPLIGYGYVIFVQVALWICRAAGWVRGSEEQDDAI